MVALSCSEPPQGYGRWSFRLLAEKMVENAILFCADNKFSGDGKQTLQALHSGRCDASEYLVYSLVRQIGEYLGRPIHRFPSTERIAAIPEEEERLVGAVLDVREPALPRRALRALAGRGAYGFPWSSGPSFGAR